MLPPSKLCKTMIDSRADVLAEPTAGKTTTTMGRIRKMLVRTSEDWSLVAEFSTNIELRIYHPILVFPTKGMLYITHLIAANEADYFLQF